MFFATKRATVLIPSGPADRPDLLHLFVLLCDPFGEPPQCLLVSISTVRQSAYHDPACLLYVGDHAFVKHTSYVKYSSCRLIEAARLERAVEAGTFKQHDMMDGAVVARILQACLTSRRTPQEIKDLIVAQGWVDTDEASASW